MIEINALTLTTTDMAESIRFWRVLGLPITYGGADSPFTTLQLGENYINLTADETRPSFWGRAVIHVPSPDELWARFAENGFESQTEPADAPWGERYFHILDPSGHEISFARRLDG